jgi:hypothetical protein
MPFRSSIPAGEVPADASPEGEIAAMAVAAASSISGVASVAASPLPQAEGETPMETPIAAALAAAAPKSISPGSPQAGLGALVTPLPVPRPDPGSPDLGALVIPVPRPRPEVLAPAAPGILQEAALSPVRTGLVARQTRRQPAPACLARLAEMGVEFAVQPAISEQGCGSSQPLLVHSLAEGSLRLEPVPVLECPVAEALAEWVDEEVQPLARTSLGNSVTRLRVAASYSCRGINNARTGRLSEHAYANAIDLSAFEIGRDEWIEVAAQKEGEQPAAAFLDGVRSAACEHFHTVLGPGTDAAHADHFHLDLAPRGRTGTARYCR